MGGPTNSNRKAASNVESERRPPLPLVRNGQVLETVNAEGQDRLTERYTEEAVKFIREHKDQPFFLYMPHTAVHVPIHPGDKFRNKSANGRYGDWVEELDWSVGRVMDTVRDLGLSERTLVFFTSDNGPWLTQGTNGGVAGPLRGGKQGTYEGGVREPTIAWWPGKVPAGVSVDAITANYDLLPTLVTLAGGRIPSDHIIDGKNIAPILLGQTRESPHQTHYYFNGNTLEAVRSGPWKLAIVRQHEHSGQPEPSNSDADKPFVPTLYNLDNDIGERHDVAAQHPDVVQRLQKLVKQMDADLGAAHIGPGVRPPGRFKNPTGLWLPGQEPSATTK
jgi:arylsulfatase A-like enzyme